MTRWHLLNKDLHTKPYFNVGTDQPKNGVNRVKYSKKADQTKVEELQKKIEDIENKIKSIEEGKEVRKSGADIMETPEKKTVEEEIEGQLKDRENEEKDRQNRRNNIIVFRLPESKAAENEHRKEEDIKQIVGLSKTICQVNIKRQLTDRENEEKDRQNRRNNIIVFRLPESKAAENEHGKEEDIKQIVGLSKTICQVNITEEAVSKAIRLGKLNEEKDWPLLITLKEEEKTIIPKPQQNQKCRRTIQWSNYHLWSYKETERWAETNVKPGKGKREGGSVRGIHVSCKRTNIELVHKEDTQENIEKNQSKRQRHTSVQISDLLLTQRFLEEFQPRRMKKYCKKI